MRILVLFLFCAVQAFAAPITELWARGFSVIPAPQKVQLGENVVVLDGQWHVDGDSNDIAFRSLVADAETFQHLRLESGSAASKVVRLRIHPGTVSSGADAEIDKQAYRLKIGSDAIEVTGNAAPGLFYGVQTLLQLLKRDAAGRLILPEAVIEDWPKLQLRFLHWDTKHHQDRIETLKRYLDWSARFKINMIGFELEDKFEYPSHPVIGVPGAFTTEQLQEIVDYGLERHIQVVPQIQAPAHLAYVLKHPEFADLRADGNNYQSSLCDPRTYDLIFSMYDDVIRATKGVDYFFVSTDEVYYAGIEKACNEPYNEENRSRHWVEFVQKAAQHVRAKGRRPLAWVEYPLLAEHVPMLPADLIDGIIGEEDYLPAEDKLGMRQLAYASIQGGEYLFPSRHELGSAYERIASGRQWKGNPIGVFGAAWDDSGLHNETFWLGWSAVAQWGWNPDTVSVEQQTAEFMDTYYGPRASNMVEVYRLMEQQAQAWGRTWEQVVSRIRGPGYGNSYGKGIGVTRRDLTLDLPPLPAMPDLTVASSQFSKKYEDLLSQARDDSSENERLRQMLSSEFGRIDRNFYNLEVFLALARFMGHHWALLEGLASVEHSLATAAKSANDGKPAAAVGHLVAAHNRVSRLQKDGEQIFTELRAVYEKSRYPKGRSMDGREFFHKLDDTKDHWADRTADLGFMMAPERSMGLDPWRQKLSEIIHSYAKQNSVPVKGLAEARLEE